MAFQPLEKGTILEKNCSELKEKHRHAKEIVPVALPLIQRSGI